MGDGRQAVKLLSHNAQAFGSSSCGSIAQFLTDRASSRAAEMEIPMSGKKNYRELDVWKLAMTMVETTYRVTSLFPDEERYGLKSQMRRCSVSIPSNIAEGQARGTAKFGLHFIRVSIGSVAELDTQTELARRLRFVSGDATRELEDQILRVRQMLYGMRREHEWRLAGAGATVLSIFLILWTLGVFE